MNAAAKKKSNDSPSNKGVFGIHHVAITGDPQRNIEFYANNLGLRFVKLTVNQDDPTSYHLYYGDEVGRPGTILTFFNWPNISKGQRGRSEAAPIRVALLPITTHFSSSHSYIVPVSGPMYFSPL